MSCPRPLNNTHNQLKKKYQPLQSIIHRRQLKDYDNQLEQAKLILWKGHCSVHVRFTPQQIEKVRAEHPGIKVIVHPEVPFDVVQAAERALAPMRGEPAGASP